MHTSLFPMALELGSQCFLRLNLHSEASSVKRGERGTILRLDGSAATVEFSHGRVRIDNIDWLEPYPGTFSRGLAALTSKPNGIRFYWTGMMCSDIKFPTSDQAQGQRFLSNRQLLLSSGTGASFYDGICALNICGTFQVRYSHTYLKKVGLIVCEHIWPWGAGSRSQFLLNVVRSLLQQMTNIPKIVVWRTTDVNAIRRSFEHVSRVVILDGADFRSHYQPLRMNWESPNTDPITGPETAIYIKPIEKPSEHIVNRPLHIPQEVLLQMFKGKQTLFLASGTCDSPVACERYLLAQLKLHNIAPPEQSLRK